MLLRKTKKKTKNYYLCDWKCQLTIYLTFVPGFLWSYPFWQIICTAFDLSVPYIIQLLNHISVQFNNTLLFKCVENTYGTSTSFISSLPTNRHCVTLAECFQCTYFKMWIPTVEQFKIKKRKHKPIFSLYFIKEDSNSCSCYIDRCHLDLTNAILIPKLNKKIIRGLHR